MKTKYFLTPVLLVLMLSEGFSQEVTKKERRAAENEIKSQQIEMLLNSGKFIFRAGYAIPTGGRPINMAGNPGYVIFNNEKMEGDLPFFGTATAGIGLSGDLAIKFKNKPQSFSTRKLKKSYEIVVIVRGDNGTYDLSLVIPLNGQATLSVSSSNRGTIAYNGEVFQINEAEQQKKPDDRR
jgi:hypothetical protein